MTQPTTAQPSQNREATPAGPVEAAPSATVQAQRFRQLAVEILARRTRQQAGFRPWLVVLWPWSWIEKQPTVRSAAIAGGAVALTLAAGAATPSALFSAKVVVAGTTLFLALAAHFWVTAVYGRLYGRLRRVALVPEASFARWYRAKVSAVLGHINLHAGGFRYGVRESIRQDGLHWALFAINSVIAVPTSCYFFARHPGPVHHLAWAGYLTLNATAALAIGWLPAQSLLMVRFAIDLARLPVRFYPGMPSSVSLSVVGDAFLVLACLYSTVYIPFVVLGNLCHVQVNLLTSTAAWIGGSFLLLGLIVSQVALATAAHRHRQRLMVEYGLHVEEAFGQFLREPSAAAHARLKELLNHAKLLRSLPVTGFSLGSAVGFAALVTVDAGLIVLAYALALKGVWLVS